MLNRLEHHQIAESLVAQKVLSRAFAGDYRVLADPFTWAEHDNMAVDEEVFDNGE